MLVNRKVTIAKLRNDKCPFVNDTWGTVLCSNKLPPSVDSKHTDYFEENQKKDSTTACAADRTRNQTMWNHGD